MSWTPDRKLYEKYFLCDEERKREDDGRRQLFENNRRGHHDRVTPADGATSKRA